MENININNNNNNNNNNHGTVAISDYELHEIINEMFHEAVAVGDIEKVKQFVSIGADVECKNDAGDGAAHVAITHRYLELLKSLIEDHGADLNAEDGNKSNLIKHAFICDDLASIILLISHGAKVDTINGLGNTLLHTCAIYNSPAACSYLMGTGLIDINARNTFNRTPLHCACRFLNFGIVQLLCIHTDIDLNAIDVDGETPFFSACNLNNYDNCDICEFLIELGCDINIKDHYDRSPLDVACNNYLFATIQLLLSQIHLSKDISNYTLKLLKTYRFLD